MPYLTRQDIEGIAVRVISAYTQLPAAAGHPLERIDPCILVHDLLHLNTEYHTLSRHRDILGLTCCDCASVMVFDDMEHPQYCFLDGRTLFIESSLTKEGANVGRLHFTLVHEACHQIFKMLYPWEYLSEVRRRKVYRCIAKPDYRDMDWEEWRTNALTSAILMPMDILVGNMHRFGLGDRIGLLNRVFESEVYERFQSMADAMGVSKKALAIRMKRLGLLEKEYLDNPYDLINVYADDFDGG